MFKVRSITHSQCWTKGEIFEVLDVKKACCGIHDVYLISEIKAENTCLTCNRKPYKYWSSDCFEKINNMKTVREWFSELEPVSRYKAIANTKPELLDSETVSLATALTTSFIWQYSPEGELYWKEVRKNIKY